jgi:hypothetical protein
MQSVRTTQNPSSTGAKRSAITVDIHEYLCPTTYERLKSAAKKLALTDGTHTIVATGVGAADRTR